MPVDHISALGVCAAHALTRTSEVRICADTESRSFYVSDNAGMIHAYWTEGKAPVMVADAAGMTVHAYYAVS